MNAETPPLETQDRPRLWVEILMAVLAVTTIWLSFNPNIPHERLLSWSIWAIFVAEYTARLVRSRSRWAFVRSNLTDLIAIMPWDLMRAFRMFRLLRVLQLFRGLAVLRRVSNHVAGILRTNGLLYALISGTAMVVVAGLLIVQLEPGISNVADGIWWSIVTSTTVGYGDMSPKTVEGRIVAVLLMIMGIGMIAMLTGSIATYFIGGHGPRNPHVRHLQKMLDEWDRMSPAERREAASMLRVLAEGDEGKRAAG